MSGIRYETTLVSSPETIYNIFSVTVIRTKSMHNYMTSFACVVFLIRPSKTGRIMSCPPSVRLSVR